MALETKRERCQCGDDVPVTWFDTCEKCGKECPFPGKRPRITHPRSFDEAKQILIDVVQHDKECKHWRGISDVEWNEAFHKLLDANFLSIEKGFFLLGAGVFCNPRLYGMVELYFIARKGAELWKGLKYSGTMYDLDICKKV